MQTCLETCKRRTMEDTLSSLSLLQLSLNSALICLIAYFYIVHSHQKSIDSFQFMTSIKSHGTRLPAILQQAFNKVQLTLLQRFIASYFLKEKEALCHHFCTLLNTLLTTQHKLHISTHLLMTHLIKQHSIYNNNWKIQLYIYIYVINRDKTIHTSRPVNNYSVLYNL